MPTSHQTLKCRDDSEPLEFERVEDGPDGDVRFQLSGAKGCSWLKDGETFGTAQLRHRIEPWLTALVQSEHLALLVGSGLSHGVHHLATRSTIESMAPTGFSYYGAEIEAEAARSAGSAGRGAGNIEDRIRAASELLRGLEIMAGTANELKDRAQAIRDELGRTLAEFAEAVLRTEYNLASAKDEMREKAFGCLVSFLMSFASRTGTRDRLHIFTTNYDRFIEAGAEVAGLHLLDRFVGSLAPVFRSSRLDIDMHYNPPGIRGEPRYLEGVARFTKLHGSLDWVDTGTSIRRIGVPFGAASIEPYRQAPGLGAAEPLGLMIYPNPAKDRETAAYPYVELFRDLAAAICRPNNTLVCYGYSFGDDHINRVIEDMLTIPSTHLVVISFDDSLNRIIPMYHRLGRHAQITLLIGNHLGDLRALVENYLPKPAIDRTTFRMAELLRARWETSRDQQRPQDDGEDNAKGDEA
jgi:hypothetical protein